VVSKLKDEDLEARLRLLDDGFVAMGLPLKYRPLQAFKDLYGTPPDGPERVDLFDPITLWFIKKYGESAHWDGVIGRIPVLLRGSVYLVLVPFSVGDTVARLIDHIRDLPADVAATFTPEEFDDLARKVAGATTNFRTLYTLSCDDVHLDDVQRGLVWRGSFDLENAATSIKHVGDTQAAVFNAHAAAEKFLKVALKRSGSTVDLQSLGHKLPRIFKELIAIENRYLWLKSSVDALQALAPNMQIRYDIVPRSIEHAISAFNASLNICGGLARIWLFDIERGTTTSTFSPGKFYRDGIGYYCFCNQLLPAGQPQSAQAVLTKLIDVPPPGESLTVQMTVPLAASPLYLEVTDEKQNDALRQTLEYRMRNRGQRINPADLGVELASGPEGSYATALVRRLVRKA
jgi:hypothetical protein